MTQMIIRAILITLSTLLMVLHSTSTYAISTTSTGNSVNLRVIEFKGGFSTFEGGKNFAKAFGTKAFVDSIKKSIRLMAQEYGVSQDEGVQLFNKSGQLQNMKKQSPKLYQFLMGISEQTQISISNIAIALNEGLYSSTGAQVSKGSMSAKRHHALKGCNISSSKGMLGQINDNPAKANVLNILVKSLDDNIMMLTSGSPLNWMMGMNKHLAIAINSVTTFHQGYGPKKGGLPESFLIMNALISYKSVDALIKHYESAKMNIALSITVSDRKGGLATMEFSSDSPKGNIVMRPKHDSYYTAYAKNPRFSSLSVIWHIREGCGYFSNDKSNCKRICL